MGGQGALNSSGILREGAALPGRTVASPVELTGAGIHSGLPCTVRISARNDGGIIFQRPGRAAVPANVSTADGPASDRRTVIRGEGGEQFDQIEHLMAAFAAAGVTDAHVEQVGPEVPFMGGGSKEFLEALSHAGTKENGRTCKVLEVAEPFTFTDGNAWLMAAPHEGLRLSCYVEFPGTVVGSAGFSCEIEDGAFAREIAPARTFALAADLERLRAAGMIRGGNLENAVVFDHERYYNDALHYPNEVVRHKLIDLLGDLALIGAPLRGHFWAWRAGHRSHVLFAQAMTRTLGAAG